MWAGPFFPSFGPARFRAASGAWVVTNGAAPAREEEGAWVPAEGEVGGAPTPPATSYQLYNGCRWSICSETSMPKIVLPTFTVDVIVRPA